VETLPNGLYRVELPNGHRVLGHVASRRRHEVKFAPGEKVILEMSFYDLSHGRICVTTK